MKNKRYLLNNAKDVPLLEQEKIKSFLVSNKSKKHKSYRIIKKASVTAVFSLFIIAFVVMFFKSDFYRDAFTDNIGTDKTSSESVTHNSESDKDASAGVDIDTSDITTDVTEPSFTLTFDNLYNFDSSIVDEGDAAVIPMDLSETENGVLNINNSIIIFSFISEYMGFFVS